MSDPYAQAAQSNQYYASPKPKETYTCRLVNVEFTTSNFDSDRGAPEIRFEWEITNNHDGFDGLTLRSDRGYLPSIRPMQPAMSGSDSPTGKPIPSGISNLNKLLECLGFRVPREEMSEGRVRECLELAIQEGRCVTGYWSGKGFFPNGPADPEQVQPTEEDFGKVPF